MGKHYNRKKRDMNTYYRKNQPCWECKNRFGGCSWSRDFTPVKGWNAEKTYHKYRENTVESYKITNCPEYRKDK